MKIESIRFAGIGRFGAETEIPIADLGDAELVALVGGNGAGKSTALELIPGSIYRTTPSRGSVANMAHGKGAFVETVFDLDGEFLRSLLKINGSSKPPTVEAFLFDANGDDLTETKRGLVGDFKREIAKRFPSKEIYLSSAFAAQTGEGSFLSIPRAGRRGLCVELLGLGKYAKKAKAATDRRKTLAEKAKKTEGALGAERAKAAGLIALSGEVTVAKSRLEERESTIAAARERDEKTKAALDEWTEEARLGSDALKTARSDFDAALEAVASSHNELISAKRSRENLCFDLNRTDKRLRGRDALAELAQLAPSRRSIVGDLEAAREKAVAAREVAATAAADLAAQIQRLVSDWNAATAKTIADRQAKIAQLRSACAARSASVARLVEDLDRARTGAGSLDRVPCEGGSFFSGEIGSGGESIIPGEQRTAAACELLAAALASRDLIPDLIERLEAERAKETYEKKQVEDELISASEFAKFSTVEPANVSAARSDLAALPKPTIREDLFDAAVAATKKANEAESSAREAEEASGNLRVLDLLVEQRADLDARHEEAKLEETATNERYEAADKERARRMEAIEVANVALDALRDREPPKPIGVGDLEEEIATARRELGRLEGRLEAAEEAAAQVERLEAEALALAITIGDLRSLEEAFGPNGIPALEIDAAGPSLSRIANDLLVACYGSRFVVSLVTATLDSKGKKLVEDFDLRVLDTERGFAGSIDDLSGGEKVIVAEAFALAICIFNARRSSLPILDLVRDEFAGALSTDNARLYIEMLRKAIQIGGFRRVYFVSHVPELWELADARLVFADGSISAVAA